jgi:hypothetical protein
LQSSFEMQHSGSHVQLRGAQIERLKHIMCIKLKRQVGTIKWGLFEMHGSWRVSRLSNQRRRIIFHSVQNTMMIYIWGGCSWVILISMSSFKHKADPWNCPEEGWASVNGEKFLVLASI